MSKHFHFYPKKELFKGEDSVAKSGKKYLRLCPNCRSEDYHIIGNKLTRIFTSLQQNECNNCGYVFKKPWTETEFQRVREFERTKR